MGSVYAAYDPELDREVALKLHRGLAEEQSRLQREAQAMAQLAHPNVAGVHDVGRVDAQVFIAIELIDDPTLRAWLEQTGHPLAQRLDVLTQAGRGLIATHEAGLVHRDFKPDNVMIGADGRARVLDFALARGHAAGPSPTVSDRASWMKTLTHNGALIGTPLYMSPEQYRGEPADARSDQFSFCVVLYEALYGQPPFDGRTFDELAKAVTSGRVREHASEDRVRVPTAIRRVIVRGLRVDPAQRWPSMTALLDALERASRRRRRAWLLAGGVAVLLAVPGTVYGQRAWVQRACDAEARVLDPAYDADARAQISAAFEASGLDYAADASARVQAKLDTFHDRWSDLCGGRRRQRGLRRFRRLAGVPRTSSPGLLARRHEARALGQRRPTPALVEIEVRDLGAPMPQTRGYPESSRKRGQLARRVGGEMAGRAHARTPHPQLVHVHGHLCSA